MESTAKKEASMIARLNNKVAIVTGSTTGIGAAVAMRFAAEGAQVMIHGRRRAEAERVAEMISCSGGIAEYYLGDLADPELPQALIEHTVNRFARIDILVNNAALMTRSNIWTTDAATLDRTLAVNTRAPLLLIRAALPHLLEHRSGAVLNIGSVNAYCGEKNQLAYAMSKGALMTMSRNLADALGREGVRVNHLNVGWVLTKNEYDLKMSEGMGGDWPQTLPASVAPSGRLLTPDEIASYALTFVEESGGFVSGAVVDLEQYPMIGRNPEKEPIASDHKNGSGKGAEVSVHLVQPVQQDA